MLLLLLMSSVKLSRWCRCLAVVLLLLVVSIPRRRRLLSPESEILVPELISAYIHGWRLWWGLSSLIQIIVAWYRRGCVDGLESSFGRQVFLILGLSTHYLRLCRLLWLGRRRDLLLNAAIVPSIRVYIVGMIGVLGLLDSLAHRIWLSIILTLLTLALTRPGGGGLPLHRLGLALQLLHLPGSNTLHLDLSRISRIGICSCWHIATRRGLARCRWT